MKRRGGQVCGIGGGEWMLNEILQMKPPQDEPGPALQTDGKLLLWPRSVGHGEGGQKS